MLLPTTKIDRQRLLKLIAELDTANDVETTLAVRELTALLEEADTSWTALLTPATRFNLDDLPALLRCSDICRNNRSGYPGLVPLSRAAFLAAVADGYIDPPIKLGSKAVAWRREVILDIIKNGVQGRRPRGRKALLREAIRQRSSRPDLAAHQE